MAIGEFRWIAKCLGGAALFAAGALVGPVVFARTAQPVADKPYKVESVSNRSARELEDLLNQKAQEGWYLQALDHDRVVFWKAPAKSQPSGNPER